MKQLSILSLVCLCGLFLFSCKKENPQANALLTRARLQYASGRFDETKKTIDSISKITPKAFRQINEGLALLDSVRYGENIHTINQSDSLIRLMEVKIDKQKKLFSFVFDRQYQEKGRYIPKANPFAAVPAQMGLRSGVEANGEMFLESIADRPLHHVSVKVQIPEGTYAETKAVSDEGANYRFQAGGKNIEVVHYNTKRMNGVAGFIVANEHKSISVILHGKNSASFSLPANAKKGIVDSYTLSRLMAERDSIRFNAEKSKLLIKYLDKQRARAIAEKAKEQLKKAKK